MILFLLQASILQQTAEYIYSLEQEKTRLLSQNCHLKRLLDQHEGSSGEANQITIPKKRKIEGGIVVQAISDSSDEGLGSMSPEHVPVSFVTVVSSKNAAQQGHSAAIQVTAKDFVEMKQQLEAERKQRQRVEDQLRQLESQLYPDRTVHYQEVIEHADVLRDGEEMTIIEQPVNKISLSQLKGLHHSDMENVLLSLESIPSVGQTQVVVCSPVGDLIEENSRPISPSDLVQDEIKQDKIIITTEKRSHLPQTRVVSSILEAAIKAEPKVEVERIDAPSTIVIEEASASKARHGSPAPQSRMYVTNTSRQNLETIVEAIRHLEGDHLFEEVQVDQEAPLALTTKQAREAQQREREHRKIQLEINPFLKFNTNSSTPASSVTVIPATVSNSLSQTPKTVTIQQQQVNRPGVIVVKQASS